MLIDGTVYLVISIAIPSLVLLVVIWMAIRRAKRWVLLVGLLTSGLLFGFLQVCAIQVYVYSEREGVQNYRVISSYEWNLENDMTATAEFQEIVKVTIINNSRRVLMLEEIVYTSSQKKLPFGVPYPQGEVVWIEPYSSESISLPDNKIDYFFDDELPETIEEYGAGAKSKYWLHDK